MRTSPTGCSSTSGVDPISSRRFGATMLRTALEDVDRRTGLAEHLVDPPHEPAALGFHRGAAKSLDEFGLATLQPRQRQQVRDGVPRSVLEHALTPFAVEWLGS